MPRIIAIDLGSRAVKATVLRTGGRTVVIEEQVSEPVPQDGEGVPGFEERLEALDSLLEDHKGWTTGGHLIGLAWPSDHAILHPFSLPFTDKAQVEKTLPFAIEDEVPFDIEEMHLAWRVCEVTEQTHTMVALARRQQLLGVLEGLKERKLDPRTVYVTGELLGTWAVPDRVVAVMDVGHASTTLSLAVGGTVRQVRVVGVGGRDLARALASAQGLSFSSALSFFEGDAGLPGPAGEEAATDPGHQARQLTPAGRRALDGVLGQLLAEVRSTLITFEDELEVEVDELCLTGGAGSVEPLADYLRQDLGVPVRTPVDRDNSPVAGPYAVSMALAQVLAGRVAVDAVELRTGPASYKGGVDIFKALLTYGSVLIAFFAVVTVVTFVVQSRSMSKELEQVDEQIKDVVVETFPDVTRDAVRDGTVAKAIMKERTDEAVTRAAMMGGGDGVPPTIDLLTDITEAFPPPDQVTVDVRELVIAPGAITMKAETDGYGEVATIEEFLRKNEKFKAAETKDPKQVRDKIQFNINIPMGGAEAEGGG